jgi:mono/diheme cytochrome c family protein
MATVENLAEGERLFNVYCWNCHGKKGGNDGPVISGGKFPPPPWANYQSEYIQTLPVGKMFHTITFGKGLMGSHASVLTPTERWKVILYIQKLSLGDKVKVGDATTSADSTSTNTTTKN